MAKEKITKGCWGYRRKHRRMQVMIIALFAVLIIIQLAARGFTDSEAAKNVLTVMAVLTVLPMANIASPFLASFPYKTMDREKYEKYAAYENQFAVLYDLIVTTKEYMIPMDVAVVHPTGVYCYCTREKLDYGKAEKALNQIFVDGHLDPTVKLIPSEAAFERRLESLKPASQYEDDGCVEYGIKLLKAISM